MDGQGGGGGGGGWGPGPGGGGRCIIMLGYQFEETYLITVECESCIYFSCNIIINVNRDVR